MPPRLIEDLQSSDGVQGTDHHLSCKADGLPSPAFRFYKVQLFTAVVLNCVACLSLMKMTVLLVVAVLH